MPVHFELPDSGSNMCTRSPIKYSLIWKTIICRSQLGSVFYQCPDPASMSNSILEPDLIEAAPDEYSRILGNIEMQKQPKRKDFQCLLPDRRKAGPTDFSTSCRSSLRLWSYDRIQVWGYCDRLPDVCVHLARKKNEQRYSME